ncbi:putative alpha/beta hydrolase fold [Lyophyllum shimeji]|uniref:Alpha/beta hydrolase fold n=1 Tax=Lyophyllum shimeji TaxID=47721 RepID=A0A9P3PFH0_LYOSH|nr:putative alpha/beta hydrolase fold [Lyophyllum shimeji]
MEFLDIPYSAYTTDAQRQLDIHMPGDAVPNPLPPLIVFIHGGAWRTEDKGEHRKLARDLATATGFPVAVPNYRLTPRDPPDDNHFRHPGHAEDALQALIFLTTWKGPSAVGRPIYDPNRFYLMGHSCGAHMLSSIFLDSSSVTPTLAPPPSLLRAVQKIIMSEGIYDLDLLLSTFPNYRDWFVAPAFGRRESYAPFSTTTYPLIDKRIKWLIIHSKGDTLVDLPQSDAMYQHLCELNGGDASTRIHRNTEQLSGEHNDILLGLEFVEIVKNYILDDE